MWLLGRVEDFFVLLPRIFGCGGSFTRAFLLGRLVNFRKTLIHRKESGCPSRHEERHATTYFSLSRDRRLYGKIPFSSFLLGVFWFRDLGCLRVILFYSFVLLFYAPSKTFRKGSNWTHRAIKAAVSLLIFPKESWIVTELCLYAHPA